MTTNDGGLVLALGGGGARGLAHIGVLEVLAKHGVQVRAVAGTSVGAEIGAFVANGMPLADMMQLATSFDWKQTLQLFLPDLPAGGLVSGRRVMSFLTQTIGDSLIEELGIGYVALATDLETGEEVVLDRGPLVDAVRASISMPAVFAPHQLDGRYFVDGGVVNPLPFDVARERFGGPVLAVAVHAGAHGFGRPEAHPARSSTWTESARQLLQQPWVGPAEGLRQWLEEQVENHNGGSSAPPVWRARRVLDQVMAITQAQNVRLRGALAAPDIMLAPEVDGIDSFEFYRGAEAVAAGRAAAEAALPAIMRCVGR
ncbi:MAG: patatin-like phospholipase family protein [Gammaproteobacteria bacterium]|nr:patatin-like phospholipase family protein [Gammaproteobacteria bacterium]